ncbi:HTH-type quorum sensing-dependent transcriptional regulator vjbR [Legionella pneumophila]|uniref:helix-turn-helix transcriptional regulator n=1 Tax=Legionella pneumophila TaxID=446 RepID=UPI000770A4F3|nr:helix-turn-helix transcriptional regulator [Legionella pneumophila]CZJ91067.1 HTH-type quorum sensing-dependent transcriptional regulator vjbR [Legionella pneumophila]CZJ94565.1 HTH-type quorum sensing-dependent transcriptional regulator vjbR [Legionella pneumophila]CZK41991.1 HTH-type quorum sensing-dependent transcriptional regulator vjbR [Legionella pneumophila]CZK45361.1 HTH-type quorum sensing-dependent transcriptional regulator vjbR [Legionella pneumophila]CZK60399.1 HTH-type quorum s
MDVMDIKSLGIQDIIDPEGIDKKNYYFIASIKFEKEIAQASNNLKAYLGVDYFSICLILPNGRKHIISNNPGNIAIPYQINGLNRLDTVFESANSEHLGKNFFSASQLKQDTCSKIYTSIMNERFNVFNTWGFFREFNGFKFTVIFAKQQQTSVIQLNYVVEKNMVKFIDNFLTQILPIYSCDYLDLKYSRIFQDESFRQNFLQGKYKSTVPELKPREYECLFWARYGKRSNEIAEILGLKRSTIKNYLESVREKFQVSNLQEAITLALQYHLIS